MPPALSRREQDRVGRHGRMRRRILKAAMRLFLRQGFANVTLRNIAGEIGYSPASIYRYFENKDEIFFALRGEGFERFQEVQQAARRDTRPMQRLREHAQAYIGFALENPEYYELMFIEKAPIERAGEREEWAATVESLRLLRDDVQLAIDADVLCTDDVDAAVFAFWSLLHGVMALILRNRFVLHTALPNRELATRAVDFVLHGVTDVGTGRRTRKRQRQDR